MTTTSPPAKGLPGLDSLLTDPTSLLVGAALVWPASRRIEDVAETVGLEEAELDRQLLRLREVGYVETHLDVHEHNWAWITEEGQERLVAHLKALRLLLAKVDALVVRQ